MTKILKAYTTPQFCCIVDPVDFANTHKLQPGDIASIIYHHPNVTVYYWAEETEPSLPPKHLMDRAAENIACTQEAKSYVFDCGCEYDQREMIQRAFHAGWAARGEYVLDNKLQKRKKKPVSELLLGIRANITDLLDGDEELLADALNAIAEAHDKWETS